MSDIISNIVGAVIIVFVVIIVFGPFALCLYAKYSKKDTMKCKKCKGTMVNKANYLYLLPVMFDQQHEESAEYYLNNMYRIDDISHIPNGGRACYMCLFQCQDCGHKNINIVDFLKDGENEVLKGGGVYEYESFKHLLD